MSWTDKSSVPFPRPLSPCEVDIRGEALLSALDDVAKMRSWSRALRLDHQWRAMIGLVEKALSVPFYREMYKRNGFELSALKTWDDYRRIPVATKEDLRAASSNEAPVSQGCPAFRVLSSSGSTGIPAKMGRTESSLWNYLAWNVALYFDWCCGKPLSTAAYLMDLSPGGIDLSVSDLLRTIVPDEWLIPISLPPSKLAKMVSSDPPEFISSYPSTMLAISLLLQNRPVNEVKLIHLTSEVLSRHTRRMVGRAFPSAQILETYTSTEAGLMAYQCLAGQRLHVVETNVIAEIVDADGSPTDETGYLVVTDLTNTATPIVRYRGLGDLVRWSTSPCPCGSGLRSISPPEGRSSCMLYDRMNSTLSPFTATNAVEDLAGLAQYQIVQRVRGELEVRLVAMPRVDPSELSRKVSSALGAALGVDMKIAVVTLPSIPAPAGSHKVPLVVSEITGSE